MATKLRHAQRPSDLRAHMSFGRNPPGNNSVREVRVRVGERRADAPPAEGKHPDNSWMALRSTRVHASSGRWSGSVRSYRRSGLHRQPDLQHLSTKQRFLARSKQTCSFGFHFFKYKRINLLAIGMPVMADFYRICGGMRQTRKDASSAEANRSRAHLGATPEGYN